MNDGCRILEWARQHQHTLTWIAEKMGYSRQALSQALHNNHISPRLADALLAHFSLRVIPTSMARDQSQAGIDARKPTTNGRRGRAPGAGSGPGESKLDPHQEDIEYLLANGSTQRFLASRYGTTASSLYNWMKKRGLRRRKFDK